jgi:hypothetical protein
LLLALWVGLRLFYVGQKERRQECLRYWGGIAVRERMQLGGGPGGIPFGITADNYGSVLRDGWGFAARSDRSQGLKRRVRRGCRSLHTLSPATDNVTGFANTARGRAVSEDTS